MQKPGRTQKNKKKGKQQKSIEQKLVSLVFEVALMALGIFGAVMSVGLVRMKDSIEITVEEMWQSAGDNTSRVLKEEAMEKLQNEARGKASLCDAKLYKIQCYVEQLADAAADVYSHPEENPPREALEPSPGMEGIVTLQALYPSDRSGVDMAEVGMAANLGGRMTTIARTDQDIREIFVASENGFTLMSDPDSAKKTPSFDAREREWYQKAAGGQELIWTDVYDDYFGRGLTTTCAKPFYDSQGRLRGVAGISCLLSELNGTVLDTAIGRSGYVMLVSDTGQVMISPKLQQEDGTARPFNLFEEGNPPLAEAAARMTSGEAGVVSLTLDGQEVFLAYQPMKYLPWSVCSVLGMEEVMNPVTQSQDNFQDLFQRDAYKFSQSIIMIAVLMLAVLGIVVVVTFLLGFTLSKRLTKPIMALTEGVKEISRGNLDMMLDIHTGDEIEDLADTFNVMTIRLKDYIMSLSDAAAQEQRTSAEMGVARQIQASILPERFPARDSVQVVARSYPAKEVGGDIYDYFLVDDDHLCFMMADASGKGVPAALFMVIAHTLLKDNTHPGSTPAEVFNAVNGHLCIRNVTGMFVTAFMGILELSTGRLTYANAGHNPPLIYRSGEDFQWLHMAHTLFLAGMEDTSYKNEEIYLSPGDQLFLYTDGITEAKNNEGEFFTKERLSGLLNLANVKNSEPEGMLRSVKQQLEQFCQGAEQSDDISMLILKYREKRSSHGIGYRDAE